jgi:hypothetical protein
MSQRVTAKEPADIASPVRRTRALSRPREGALSFLEAFAEPIADPSHLCRHPDLARRAEPADPQADLAPTVTRMKLLRQLALWPLLAAFGCTNVALQPIAGQDTAVDDHLQIHTTFCTQKPNPSDFPVKVLFIVDQSGSMCISDPPGSQSPPIGSLCEQYCQQPAILNNPQVAPGCATNNAQPARVLALHQIINNFMAQNAAVSGNPALQPIQVGIVPFETNVQNTWPGNGLTYQAPGGDIDSFIDNLQSTLGNGTDYQGVLDYARTAMSTDMEATKKNNPDVLPRSRYVVVFLTDGTPYPRCTSTQTFDGGLPNADYANYDPFNSPWLTWMDDPNPPDAYCLSQPSGTVDTGKSQNGQPPGVSGYSFGTDRNQNYQIFDIVNQMMSLKNEYHVAAVNLDTVLLLNPLAVQLCGLICEDVYGSYPGLNVSQFSQATFSVASYLLARMANIGNGVFQAFTNGQIQDLSLAGLDYASFASPNVMKNLFVQSLSTIPTPTGRVFDSDGEGLPDSVDNPYTDHTTPFNPDSDNDGFDDLFEVNHATEGFNPAVPDLRGCPASPGGCSCNDTDGDGLSGCAEAFLGTSQGITDSDADGIPDGLEVRYGFDPLTHDDFAHQDTDGDGISDLDEFRANTDPTVADSQLYATDGYQYAIKATTQPDNSVCYDVTISNLKLFEVPSQNGFDGFNLFKIWFDQAPQSILDSDYGVWNVACAWASYQPPSYRVPQGPLLDMSVDANGNSCPSPGCYWLTTDRLTTPGSYIGTASCAGVSP